MWACLSASDFCGERVEVKTYLDGEEITAAEEIVLFIKSKDIRLLDKEASDEVENLDMFGKIVFEGKNDELDRKMSSKEAFSVTYETSSEVISKLSFLDCMIYKVDENEGLFTYRFKARRIE